MEQVSTIIIGGLNTDFVASGIAKFPEPGQLVIARKLSIGAGGKSRNIAQMIAVLTEPDTVAMIGRTVRDDYGLWQKPVSALKESGVNIDYINVLESLETNKLPGIALIPVDEQGSNKIFLIPGVNEDFSPADIDKAEPLFAAASQNNGILAFSMECPLETTVHAVQTANRHNLRVIIDPGGLQDDQDISELLKEKIYLLKPNEHEAQMLTGIKVEDFASARQASTKLRSFGIENIFITVGAKGGYLFSNSAESHIPVPKVQPNGVKDETGCGDQTMAMMTASLQQGKSLEESANLAILAGTLQFHKSGIQPVTASELEEYS